MTSESQNLKDKDEVTAVLAEYKALQDQMLARMNHRITLLTSSTTSAAILLGLALERQSNWLLLLVPMITCLFGLLIVYHNTVIYDLGDYIGTCIEPRLNKVYPLALGWHISAKVPRFGNIFGVWHLPMILATLVPSLAAILLSFFSPKLESGMIGLLILDILLLSYFLIEYRRRVWLRNSYRTEAIRKWSQSLHEHNLIE